MIKIEISEWMVLNFQLSKIRIHTLFQDGRYSSIRLLTCKLALIASFKGKYCFKFRV